MTPYWLLIFYPILASLAPIRTNYSLNLLNLTIFAVFAILIIGLRFEVGGAERARDAPKECVASAV